MARIYRVYFVGHRSIISYIHYSLLHSFIILQGILPIASFFQRVFLTSGLNVGVQVSNHRECEIYLESSFYSYWEITIHKISYGKENNNTVFIHKEEEKSSKNLYVRTRLEMDTVGLETKRNRFPEISFNRAL